MGASTGSARTAEWLKFLRLFVRRTSKGLTLRRVADNYATHSQPEAQAWLAMQPRFVMHLTPTGASCLNMVERFFRDITDKRIRRASFTSLPELELAIGRYVARQDANPKPFSWPASTSGIPAEVTRDKAALAAASGLVHNRAAHYISYDR